MDDDPSGLVHDQQVFVLIGDSELAFLRLQDGVLPLDDVHLELLAAPEPGALRASLAVQPYCSGDEQALCFTARTHLRQAGDEPVEPFTRSVGRDLKPD
jgi:hypothetical protein